jgi:simple sugar transport system ATP-binding protein
MEANGGAIVLMERICKSFKEVQALKDVTFQLSAGEVRALVGENGAGKSTLVSILYGMFAATSGEITCFGRKLPRRWTSIQAIRIGIGMIHQHFSSAPAFTVLENVTLPLLRWSSLRPDWKSHEEKIAAIAEDCGFQLDLRERVESLSVGEKQQVEILKAIYQGARILILDEPTGALTPQQAGKLLRLLLDLKARGYSVILVTHKLEEAMAVCDTVTVLRNGLHVGTVQKAKTTAHEIARMMIERGYIVSVKDNAPPKERVPVLKVESLTVNGQGGGKALDGVSLTVDKGEIVGVAGVSGNGQSELAESIVGVAAAEGGRIELDGERIEMLDIRKRRKLGLGYIPEDRHVTGLILDMTLAENMLLDRLGLEPFAKRGLVRFKEVNRFAEEQMRAYKIKAPGTRALVGTLSGGNQQKVVLARAITASPKAIITCQPTWGLDFGATEFVRGELVEHARSGAGILLISSDLDELLELSHRIIVIFRGRIVASVARADVDIVELGLMMAGGPGKPAEKS